MITNLKSQTNLSGFYVTYSGSTNLERKGCYGISHLMEHLVCKNYDHLLNEFSNDGINVNAYTSSNEIVFYMQGLDNKINKWKDSFVELLGNFKITEEEFKNEKKIVIEEYMDSLNEQSDSHFINLYRKLFNNYLPIGLKQDLENITLDDCKEFFKIQFLAPSKIINVSKSNDYENNSIIFNNSRIDKTISYGINDVSLELNNEFKDKTSLIMLSPIINDNIPYIEFINSMLCYDLNSPFYSEIREKRGLVYSINNKSYIMNNQSINNITSVTSNENYNELVDTINMVMKNPDKYMTKDRFEIIKNLFLIRREKQEILRYNYIDNYINKLENSVYGIIDDISYSKIREVYEKYFNFDEYYISSDKIEFLK